jgi:hypothetical protein
MVSKMMKLQLPAKTILKISIAIATGSLIVMPAKADVIPDQPAQPKLSECFEVTNLNEYPEYQIFARIRTNWGQAIANNYFRDITLKPGKCNELGDSEAVDLYAAPRAALDQVSLDKKPGTERIMELNLLTNKLILGKDISKPDYSSTPFYAGAIQRKIQIVELGANRLTIKTKEYTYPVSYGWIFLAAVASGILLTTIGTIRHLSSLSRGLK